jgi:hypothetical protein
MLTRTGERARDYVPWICGILTSAVILFLMNRDYPQVGHDYRYFLVRMLDTKLFLLLNGPAIQWYTPSFGGGLPAFANPQHIEYSVVQFLSLLMNPWRAVMISTFVFSLVGFMAFQRFLQHTLRLHWTSSTLGAIFFVGNGFFIEHMIVGHIGHQLYPLGSLLLSSAVDSRQPVMKSAALIGLIIALMVHQTGFYIVVILGLSLLVALPFLYVYDRGLLHPGQAVKKLAIGTGLAGVIAGSKIFAVVSLMQLFPRAVSDVYPVGFAQGLLGLTAQLLGVMFLTPFLILTGKDVSLLSGGLANITGAHYGIWETDIGLSPVLVFLLLVGSVRLAGALRRKRNLMLERSPRLVASLLLLAGIWITLEMTLAQGILFPYIKALPFLRSMHVNIRFAAAFLLPLTLAGVFVYESLSHARPRQSLFLIAAPLSLAFLLIYQLIPADVHSRTYNLTQMLQTDSAIQGGERFPVERIAFLEEDAVFLARASNVLYYEPLFSRYHRTQGYILESFLAEVQPGAITEIEDGYYNMTNPASLVFPRENNLEPFERIRVGEEAHLQTFARRGQPAWKIPVLQRVLNWTSLGALVLSISLLLLPIRLQKRGART